MRLLLTALLLVHGAAMGQTFACQYVATSGLRWENGRWTPTAFKSDPPFFLKVEAGQLTTNPIGRLYCDRDNDGFYCASPYAAFLFFDPKTSAGAVSKMLGSVSQSPSYRDTLSVAPFTCQQM